MISILEKDHKKYENIASLSHNIRFGTYSLPMTNKSGYTRTIIVSLIQT
uniref:Uncharacterized protein n=1 Tax=Lepeophtheirus salmonis TaxID=72036 RepID=A0A0K2TWV6_LEPSM